MEVSCLKCKKEVEPRVEIMYHGQAKVTRGYCPNCGELLTKESEGGTPLEEGV